MIAQTFVCELKEAYNQAEAEWRSIQRDLQTQIKGSFDPLMFTTNGKIDCRISPAGFGINTVYRLLLAHSGRTDYLRFLPMAAFIEFDPI